METGYLSRYGSADDPHFRHKVVVLERRFSEMVGVDDGVTVSEGTGAIMAALVALGVGPDTKVLVPGYTFFAPISAIPAVGGIPMLTEFDESLTVDPSDLKQKISTNTRIIMPVHMLSNPVDLNRIAPIARKYGLFVL